jgi:hypothetical protein
MDDVIRQAEPCATRKLAMAIFESADDDSQHA